MIEDRFIIDKISGQPDEAIAAVECRECHLKFDVHMQLFRTKNCRYVLGQSMTIMCPRCKVEATTTEIESRIASIKPLIQELETRIEKYLHDAPIMFYVIEYDVNTLTLKLRCKGCEHEFVCDIHNVSNISKTYMGAMVTCPKCGAHEEFSAEKVIEREIVASAITELESMKCTLAEAEKKVGQPCQ